MALPHIAVTNFYGLNEVFLNVKTPRATRSVDFEDLINAIPALVLKMDCNLQIVYANNQFLKIFPVASDFFHLAVGVQVFEQIQRHLGYVLVGENVRFTISLENEGGIQYLDISLTPQFDARHQVSSIIFHGLDVTGQMNDQRTLHDYFENATIGLHWVDSEGVIIWVNPAELKMLGYEEHEYKGQNISRFHKNQDCIKDILARLSKGEVLKNYEAEIVCKDGTTRFVSINSSVLWEGNEFIHTRCFTIDITAQKIAAKAVKESEQRFKIMADLVPLVILTSDENGMCTFLNGRWKELTGKDIEEGIGDQWLNAVHPEDRAKISSSWNKSLEKRSVFEAKLRMLNGLGGYTVCYFNALPRFDSQNNFIGYTGTIQDFSIQEQITASLEKMVLDRTNDLRIKNTALSNAERALKAKNEELEKINNELSSFAHVASHDLQEPLRKIQNFTDRVLRSNDSKLSEKALVYMRKIESASTRMRAFVQDILVYSKANNAEPETQEVDLDQLIKEVLVEFEVKIEEKDATIECIGQLPVVQVTRFQFHQLFLNLISNALKFSKPGVQPSIKISSSVIKPGQAGELEGIDEYYDITVADNGIGFEAEYADRIFEIFNRLHDRQQFEGTGIGLAICKKIVERHGGKLLAEGEPGKGAKFHIYLPVTKKQRKSTD